MLRISLCLKGMQLGKSGKTPGTAIDEGSIRGSVNQQAPRKMQEENG